MRVQVATIELAGLVERKSVHQGSPRQSSPRLVATRRAAGTIPWPHRRIKSELINVLCLQRTVDRCTPDRLLAVQPERSHSALLRCRLQGGFSSLRSVGCCWNNKVRSWRWGARAEVPVQGSLGKLRHSCWDDDNGARRRRRHGISAVASSRSILGPDLSAANGSPWKGVSSAHSKSSGQACAPPQEIPPLRCGMTSGGGAGGSDGSVGCRARRMPDNCAWPSQERPLRCEAMGKKGRSQRKSRRISSARLPAALAPGVQDFLAGVPIARRRSAQ